MRIFHTFWDVNGKRHEILPLFTPWLLFMVAGIIAIRIVSDNIPHRALSITAFAIGVTACLYFGLVGAVALTAKQVFREYDGRR